MMSDENKNCFAFKTVQQYFCTVQIPSSDFKGISLILLCTDYDCNDVIYHRALIDCCPSSLIVHIWFISCRPRFY